MTALLVAAAICSGLVVAIFVAIWRADAADKTFTTRDQRTRKT